MTNLKMSTIHNGHYHPLYHAGRAVRPDGYGLVGLHDAGKYSLGLWVAGRR
jgi:hypothetical protein